MYIMGVYTCDACKFTTPIKSHYSRHLTTAKHIENTSKTSVSSDLSSNEDELEWVVEQIGSLKTCFEECKQMFMELKNQTPTYTPPTQTTPLPPPPQITINNSKPVDETCNPRYIEKQLNDNPLYNDTPDIHTFFLRKSPHINFDFSDVEGLSDVLSDGKSFVIDYCVDVVRKTLAAGKTLPFVFKKGSWYIKGQDNLWEKEDIPASGNNPAATKFVHSIIVKKLTYIILNRFIDYWTEKTDGNQWLRSNTALELLADVFKLELYHNKEFLKPLAALF